MALGNYGHEAVGTVDVMRMSNIVMGQNWHEEI